MQKLLITVAVFLSLAIPATAEKPKPNPADFAVTVHIVYSHYITRAAGPGYQQLDAVIDGVAVQLECDSAQGVLKPNDYKARLVTDFNIRLGFIPRKVNGYDIFKIYFLLMPDGTEREYDVVGIGLKDGGQPATQNP